MKKHICTLLTLATFPLMAFEYDLQFENEAVIVSKAIIDGHEELGLHRDTHPSVVIGLKGGVITRIEADGTEIAVAFPQGAAVFRSADPIDTLHRGVNRSEEALELMIIQLKEI